jgi:hypothetical protein
LRADANSGNTYPNTRNANTDSDGDSDPGDANANANAMRRVGVFGELRRRDRTRAACGLGRR